MRILLVLDRESHSFLLFRCLRLCAERQQDLRGDGDARCPSIGESNSNNSGICSPCLCLAFIEQTPKSSIFFPQLEALLVVLLWLVRLVPWSSM
jgi:hypothetical protein